MNISDAAQYSSTAAGSLLRPKVASILSQFITAMPPAGKMFTFPCLSSEEDIQYAHLRRWCTHRSACVFLVASGVCMSFIRILKKGCRHTELIFTNLKTKWMQSQWFCAGGTGVCGADCGRKAPTGGNEKCARPKQDPVYAWWDPGWCATCCWPSGGGDWGSCLWL